jgi:hypothetical protein
MPAVSPLGALTENAIVPVQALEQDGLSMEEVAGQDPLGLGGQELQVRLARRGAGSIPHRLFELFIS